MKGEKKKKLQNSVSEIMRTSIVSFWDVVINGPSFNSILLTRINSYNKDLLFRLKKVGNIV